MMCTKVIWGQNSSLTERFASPEVPNREIKWIREGEDILCGGHVNGSEETISDLFFILHLRGIVSQGWHPPRPVARHTVHEMC